MTAQMVFDEVDDYLTFPFKRMGLVTLFNGIDVEQTRDYINISVETYLERVCETTHEQMDDTPANAGQAHYPASE